MPVGIGGVGDILAIIGIVREFASALNGSRGSAAEYQEVQRELDGLEKALLCHHQLLQARCDDPVLNAIFRSTQSTAEDCQKCIEAFSQQTVKFDRSLGVDPSGNVCRDVMMKVRWQMSKKEEVVRFRAQLGQHISSLNMLFALANINMQRDTHDKIDSKLDVIEKKIDSNSKAHETSITELQDHVEKGISQNENAATSIRGDLGWLRQIGSELKGVVTQIFTMSGTTLSAIQRIEQRLPSNSEMALIRTFTLEDAIGRITQVDMVFVSSWDAFDAMLEGCFREFPGHKMVARKQYVFQDQKTNREIKRSIPWSGALVPGQYINMGLIFRKRSSKNKRFYCPYCHLALEQSPDGLIPCQCGMSHQRRTETMNVDEEQELPKFDLPDMPSGDEGNFSKLNDSLGSPTVQAQSVEAVDLNSQVEYEDMSSFKRVIVVEVEMNIIPLKPPVSESTTPTGYSFPRYNTPPHPIYYPFRVTTPPTSGPSPGHSSRHTTSGDAYGYSPRRAFSPRYDSTGKYVPANGSGNKSSWSASAARQSGRRNPYSYRASYGDSDEDEYECMYVDGVLYRVPASRPTRDGYNYRGGPGSTAQYYYPRAQRYLYETEDPDALPHYKVPPRRARRQSSSSPQRPHAARPTNGRKKPPLTPKATEADARKHRIPPGYSLRNWDPNEEPIMLLGSVFDGNSLGKWIYDWTVYHHGPATQIADMAGELWLLLIQLVGKTKRADESMPRIKKEENREMIEDFIESGERLLAKFKKLLKACETPMLRAGKSRREKEQTAQVMTVGSSAKSDETTLNAESDKASPVQVQSAGPSSSTSTTSLDPTPSSSTSSDYRVIIKEEAKVSESKATRMLGKNAGTAFVDSIFGKDRQLEATEKFMASVRLWNLRFDANCEHILKNPTQ